MYFLTFKILISLPNLVLLRLVQLQEQLPCLCSMLLRLSCCCDRNCTLSQFANFAHNLALSKRPIHQVSTQGSENLSYGRVSMCTYLGHTSLTCHGKGHCYSANERKLLKNQFNKSVAMVNHIKVQVQ